MNGRRLSVRDRFYADIDVAKVIGPLDGVAADAVRAALTGMHADRPDGKALSRLDRVAGRWRPVAAHRFPGWAHDLVLDLDGDDDPGKVAARMMAEPLGERPLLLGAGGPYAGIRFNHALGDAWVGGPLFVAALTAAVAGGPAHYPIPPSARLPLLRATARHFGRNPARLVAAARVGRAPRDADAGRAQMPWAPAEAIHWSRSAPGAATALRRWRDAHVPGASIGAVLSAAVSASFDRHLSATARDGLVMLVDARRYLPSGLVVDGNFAAGEYLAPVDRADVRAVHDLMAARLASGRSLAALALHHGRLMVDYRRVPARITSVPVDARPQLTLAYLGRSDAYAGLPWRAGHAERTMIDVVGTTGPQGVTVAVEEFGDVLHATTTYHTNVFDPAAIAAATDAVVGDPAAVL